MSEKQKTWWYAKFKKDVIHQSFKDGKPRYVPSQHIDIEEVIVCSEPTENWPYENGHTETLITHPLEMLAFYKEHFRNWRHETGDNEYSMDNSMYEMMFWAEIPETIARKFKEELE